MDNIFWEYIHLKTRRYKVFQGFKVESAQKWSKKQEKTWLPYGRFDFCYIPLSTSCDFTADTVCPLELIPSPKSSSLHLSLQAKQA